MTIVDERDERAQDKRVRLGLMEQRAESLENRARSCNGTRVEQGQEKFRVVALQFAEVVDVANLVPDDDTEIPERIQEAVDEPLFRGPNAAAKEQQQVDVGVQAQMTATVATEGDNGQRPVVTAGVGEQLANQRVHAVGVLLERGTAAGTARDGRAQRLPRGVKRHLQCLARRSAI